MITAKSNLVKVDVEISGTDEEIMDEFCGIYSSLRQDFREVLVAALLALTYSEMELEDSSEELKA